MPRQIALLRGVNVGGNKKVEMAKLRALMEELGYRDVRTYVNSGNVVFSGRSRPAKHLETAIAKTFGFEVPVVLRTRDELAAVVKANPLRKVANDPAKHLVVFCSEQAPVELEAADFEPETFVVRGREVYLWTPGGLRNSPLAKLLANKSLGTKSTARNWRTVEKLLELADEG
ncbi:MAG: hypothetical protein QOH95_1795 [Gaiellaceae bacterium]|jgi:uncharacterized protein (DUF1697 family)|nr:hypothetical protein [Gaiellaceae bacterium]